jgi:aryl-alcohol dehydrogenase-like predicted oxidoreductase
MRFTYLGRTGLKISAIVLGCGNFGGMGSQPATFGRVATRLEAFAIMDRAWELGINCFDTANSYGGGQSETFIGEWLKQKGAAVRHQLVLSTKVRSPVGPGPNDQGLSRPHILSQIDLSLRRLGLDYLDLYITHSPDPSTPLEETLDALDSLVRQGKVRYIGAANMPAWLLAKALWTSDRCQLQCFEWVQNSYSLLDRSDERELFPLLQDQQLGYTPFSPLAGGWLTGRYRAGEPIPPNSRMDLRPDYLALATPQTFVALEDLRRYSAERGLDMASLALAWVLSHPLVTAPLVGPRRPEHLDIVETALAIRLDEDERATLAGFFKNDRS